MTAHLQQALQLHQQGQLASAEKIYLHLLRINNRDADAHNLLGTVYVAKKHYKSALKHLHKAVKLAPKYPASHYNLGKCYLAMGQAKKALSYLHTAVRLEPDCVDNQFVVANCLVQLGQHEKALIHYQKSISLAPNHVEAINNLGNVWLELKQPEKAIVYHQQALQLAPDYQLAKLSLAETLRSLDRQGEAVELLLQALEFEPHADIYLSLGANYQQLGMLEEAKANYLAAIELTPSCGRAYRGFTEVYKARSADDLALIEQGKQHLTTIDDKKHWAYAMGHCLDAQGQYLQAINYYDQANKLHRQAYQYSTAENVSLFKAIKTSYVANNLAQPQTLGKQGENVIFVLGMPRSGTTLVEQIIASHADVKGAGELSKLDSFSKLYKGGAVRFHQRFAQMSEKELARLANEYIDYVLKLAEGCRYVTDKLPHNFLHIGLIRKILPQAKIVHCQRHPVANCLSIYKAYFSAQGSHKYAYNQQELAAYHNLYEDLMNHWRQQLPGQFYEISYEKLTTNQEQETRRLLAYCGLPWQDACLDFYKSQRKVKTASAFQVRQPMSSKSVDLWKGYASGLKPLLDSLIIPKDYLES